MLAKGTSNEKWLIYVADGEPCGPGYMGQGAIEHTQKVVRRLMTRGVHIIGVDIGDLKDFKTMFPVSVAFKDVRSLVNSMGKLVTNLVRSRSIEVHCE